MASDELVRFGPIEVRIAQRQLLVDGKLAPIGARAFDVLAHLVGHGGRVVTKNELLDLVWSGLVVEENNLQVQISVLRKHLGAKAIATIPGRGYQFTLVPDPGHVQSAHTEAASDSTNPSTPAEAEGEAASHSQHGNLPEVLLPLIGRVDDVAALVALVRAHRVVSIVGTGGIGKTRLAQATAHALRQEFADGAWMVELAPVADPALLPAAVTQALSLVLPGHKSALDEVMNALRARAVLLVLDNCEHLLEAASAFVQALVNRAPKAHVLITSQELLKIGNEHLYRVSTLSLPAVTNLLAAQTSGAVALLVNRVQALQPTFALSERNAADVVNICRQLDGLPLAIELAAARVPLLGVTGVRERLHERFRILTGGSRTALRRHQTLLEALDWSHGLLSAEERAVFHRAAVFAGSFTMTAAQQVLGGPQLDAWAVLEHLGALVDKSLVIAESVEPPRYRLLESARSYALAKLRETGEMDATLRCHAQAVLATFEVDDQRMWTTPLRVRVDQLISDIDNLRAALDWSAQSSDDVELHIRLASASADIWVESGIRVEGQGHCERALGRMTSTTPPAIQARMLVSWAAISHPTAGPTQLAAFERAIGLFREIGDQRRLYRCLAQYAVASAISGHTAASERAVREMEELHDSRWPPLSRCTLLLAKSRFLNRVQPDHVNEERDLVLEMLQIAKAASDEWWTELALALLTNNSRERGNLDEAISRGRDLVALHQRKQRKAQALGFALLHLCRALCERGDLDEALTIAREGSDVFASQGFLWVMLTTIALLALKRGHASEAALALGRADAAEAWRDTAPPPSEMRDREDLLARLREVIGRSELERLLSEGAALTDEEAARIALSR